MVARWQILLLINKSLKAKVEFFRRVRSPICIR